MQKEIKKKSERLVSMEHIDILNHIIETELEAQKIANEARRQSEALPDELKAECEKLRESYKQRAKNRIDKVLEQEKALADERVSELEEDLRQDMAAINELAEKNLEIWVEKLFNMAIE